MAIKLEMLRVFRVVADRGALAEAAAILGRTPSAVSMTLAQLEADIGAPLFETERKNRLTKLGELVLAEAVRATDVFDSSTETIRRLTASVAGTVRVAAVPSVAATLLPGAIVQFRQSHPEVRLEISDVDSASVRRRVRLDEADIGILTAAADDPGDGVAVAQDALGIVYREGGRIDRALAEGEARPGWSLLGLEPLIANPLCALVADRHVAERRDACTLQARNTTALLSFVREGLGATILPEGVASILGGGLGFVRPADPTVRRALRMICNPGRKLGPAAQDFWNALA
ncbi:LysR family transcriptional regulator [Acidimangrovimonas pyrenivorans]|uniref:LysR family transcriptional regulator n=1 Tax=Acidimangrovimonas pyrenivorans TaxID=2030798 RepID=A0ABV7AID4_9RHOB